MPIINNVGTLERTDVQRIRAILLAPDLHFTTGQGTFHVHRKFVEEFFLVDHLNDGDYAIFDDLSELTLCSMLQFIYGLPVALLEPKQEYTTEHIIKICELLIAFVNWGSFDHLRDRVVRRLEEIFAGLKNPSQLIDIGIWLTCEDLFVFDHDEVWNPLLSQVRDCMAEGLKDRSLLLKLYSCKLFSRILVLFLKE